jgi:hypothetical protein
MRKQRWHSNKRRKRTRAEEKVRRRKNDAQPPDWFVQRCDETAFMVEAFHSIKDTIIPIVENEIPGLEEYGGNVELWTEDALRAAADVIEEAGIVRATISAIAENGSEAALPFLRQAMEWVAQGPLGMQEWAPVAL